jgi:hypothetical protein
MTDAQLEAKLDKWIRLDRKITHRILLLINEAEDRKLYAKRGFSTMKRWLVQRFLLSDTAAYQRITAANLLRAVPAAGEKIASGELNISTMNIAQKVIRAHEAESGETLTQERKAQVVEQIENKSAWTAEASLLKMFPDVQLEPRHETAKNVDGDTVRVSANFAREIIEQIEELRKLHGINGGFAEVVTFLVKTAVKGAKKSHTKHTCGYKDELSGRVCGADNWLEEDHILPVALGGTDDPENKRWLCRTHNQLEARRKLGKMADYRGHSTRSLQLKAANRVAAFRREMLTQHFSDSVKLCV